MARIVFAGVLYWLSPSTMPPVSSDDRRSELPQNSYDLSAERGRSDFDIRQRFTLSYAYDLPVLKGHRWSGGWRSFGVLTFQTGQPFTVALLPDNDNTNTGISQLGFGANDRPNVTGNPRLSNPAPQEWFDTAAFTIPPYGQFGNAGRNILDGPGLQTVNVSIVKNTALRERLTLQFRAELKVEALPERGVLDNRDVHRLEARAVENVAARVAKTPIGRGGERRGIEPLLRRGIGKPGIAGHIRPVVGAETQLRDAGVGVVVIRQQRHGERLAGLERQDAKPCHPPIQRWPLKTGKSYA